MPGLMMDRARYLRANNYEQAAAQTSPPGSTSSSITPADPDRFYDMLPDAGERRGAGPAMADGLQHHAASRRCTSGGHRRRRPTDRRPRQLHDPRLARRERRARPDATSPAARSRCSTVTRAAAARSRSRPRAIIGRDAPRWPPGASRKPMRYFQRAAAYPELFYGQLALERLGTVGHSRRPRRFRNM